ncbi:hypothetical protein SeMB42_g05845 [Synchytrium endobioticum]|uniref:Uncharacterized protein n=1 Tax=Synchytrium endobioticum TaxID=286115 RepID=A0A507CP30_9FUNG|nr:hypothetical protein SeMB42_g05845 [Synchytrium endobioticum]
MIVGRLHQSQAIYWPFASNSAAKSPSDSVIQDSGDDAGSDYEAHLGKFRNSVNEVFDLFKKETSDVVESNQLAMVKDIEASSNCHGRVISEYKADCSAPTFLKSRKSANLVKYAVQLTVCQRHYMENTQISLGCIGVDSDAQAMECKRAIDQHASSKAVYDGYYRALLFACSPNVLEHHIESIKQTITAMTQHYTDIYRHSLSKYTELQKYWESNTNAMKDMGQLMKQLQDLADRTKDSMTESSNSVESFSQNLHTSFQDVVLSMSQQQDVMMKSIQNHKESLDVMADTLDTVSARFDDMKPMADSVVTTMDLYAEWFKRINQILSGMNLDTLFSIVVDFLQYVPAFVGSGVSLAIVYRLLPSSVSEQYGTATCALLLLSTLNVTLLPSLSNSNYLMGFSSGFVLHVALSMVFHLWMILLKSLRGSTRNPRRVQAPQRILVYEEEEEEEEEEGDEEEWDDDDEEEKVLEEMALEEELDEY